MKDSTYIKSYKREWAGVWYFLIWYDKDFNRHAEVTLFNDFYEAVKFAEEKQPINFEIFTVKEGEQR